jgi:hypothetical protein
MVLGAELMVETGSVLRCTGNRSTPKGEPKGQAGVSLCVYARRVKPD